MPIKCNSLNFTVSAVLVIVLLFVYGPPLGMMLSTKWDARTQPELWVVPQPLPATPRETSLGKSFSYFGYEFESPWTEVASERKSKSVAVLIFSGGQGISIFDWQESDDLVAPMKGGSADRAAAVEAVFGADAMRSNYALTSSTLNVTPGDLRVFSSRQKMVATSLLISLKQIKMSRVAGRVYSFQTNSIRGFQVGDPLHDKTVVIEAFDAQDHRIQLFIGAKANTSPKPTQADINRILYSLRSVNTTQAK
jgi:hypothetical protein